MEKKNGKEEIYREVKKRTVKGNKTYLLYT